MPTNEKTIRGGNHLTVPLLPSNNNKAAQVNPAMKHVTIFNNKDFGAMRMFFDEMQ